MKLGLGTATTGRLVGILVISLMILAESIQGQSDLTLWYKQRATQWREAIPVGNGRLGALVFGKIADEQIILNEDTVWTGSPYGQLQERIENLDHRDDHHRHFSHLWGMYPGSEITAEGMPDLAKAAAKSLQLEAKAEWASA